MGTDHGMAAPLLLFGNGLKGGILGNAPDLDNLNNGNLFHQFDYRQIYTSLLVDWLGADLEGVEASKFENFIDSRLDLIKSPAGMDEQYDNSLHLTCYPNPARDYTVFSFTMKRYETVSLSLLDASGRVVRKIISDRMRAGDHKIKASLEGLNAGIYFGKLISGMGVASVKLIIK
jgi:hypothetical protein